MNLSTNNGIITIKFEGLPPIVIDNYDPESDMWSPAERQTADGELTPDGFFNTWALNNPIEATLTVSGGSLAAISLRAILDSQVRKPTALSTVYGVTVIVEVNGLTNIYSNGIMTASKAGHHLGSKKLQNQTFNFKFGGVA